MKRITSPQIPHWYQKRAHLCWKHETGTTSKPRDNHRSLCVLLLVQRGEKQPLTCGLEVGEERWRQSPPVSGAKQYHGNSPECCAEMSDSHQRGAEGGQSQRRLPWHSRVGEPIPPPRLFSQASCWLRHFSAPAKDSKAYLRTEQQRFVPENDIYTGRPLFFLLSFPKWKTHRSTFLFD